MPLSDIYRSVVLDHNRAPRRFGRLAIASVYASGVNALCGDHLKIELLLSADRLQDFAFEAEASALTMAATSIMGDLICGLPIGDAQTLAEAALDLITRNPQRAENPRLGEFNAFLSVLGYPNRLKTITLPWATLIGALSGRLATSTDIDIRGALQAAGSKRNSA